MIGPTHICLRQRLYRMTSVIDSIPIEGPYKVALKRVITNIYAHSCFHIGPNRVAFVCLYVTRLHVINSNPQGYLCKKSMRRRHQVRRRTRASLEQTTSHKNGNRKRDNRFLEAGYNSQVTSIRDPIIKPCLDDSIVL